MLSKKRSEWLSITYAEAGVPSTATQGLDKTEAWSIRNSIQSKMGQPIQELDEKHNPFDPTAGSTDVDKVVPFGKDRVAAALHTAMESFGCQSTSETASVLQCKRKRGHSELTGPAGSR